MSDKTQNLEDLLRDRLNDPRAMTAALAINANRVLLTFGAVGHLPRLVFQVKGDEFEQVGRKAPPSEAVVEDGSEVDEGAEGAPGATSLDDGASGDEDEEEKPGVDPVAHTLGVQMPKPGDPVDLPKPGDPAPAEGPKPADETTTEQRVEPAAAATSQTVPPRDPALEETPAPGLPANGEPIAAVPGPREPVNPKDHNRAALAKMAEEAGVATDDEMTKAQIAEVLNART